MPGFHNPALMPVTPRSCCHQRESTWWRAESRIKGFIETGFRQPLFFSKLCVDLNKPFRRLLLHPGCVVDRLGHHIASKKTGTDPFSLVRAFSSSIAYVHCSPRPLELEQAYGFYQLTELLITKVTGIEIRHRFHHIATHRAKLCPAGVV